MAENSKPQTVEVIELQKRFAIIWGGTFVLGVVMMLLMNERLGSAMMQGWGWFSQTFVPTAAVIGAGLTRSQRRKSTRKVDRFYYRFSSVALVFYALVALSTPFLAREEDTLMTCLSNSTTWLGIIQGVNVGFLTFAFGGGRSS